jgi:branched-chain amino acid aminotransferase
VIEVSRCHNSRIDTVDFDQLTFGKTFTDHMFCCTYDQGAWQNPRITPYGPISLDPSAKAFHYGQAIFEGMKAFKDDHGSVFLFRPDQNIARFNKSAERLAIPEFPEALFFEALKTLVDIDRDWVKSGHGHALYIRPFAIATETGVAASPAMRYEFMILLSPVTAYYNEKLKVLIADHYSRAADGGVGFAKAAGNYAAQFYPTNLAREKGYHQVIWTDASSHEFLEEAGTMNVFFRIGDTIITAPTSDRILDGVTRKSIIELAQQMHLEVSIRKFGVTELMEAYHSGDLKEIFGSGTAATISAVSAFGHKDKLYTLPEVTDAYADRIKHALQEIQYNRADDPFGWRVKV